MAVTRQVGKGKARRYNKVNLGGRRSPADLTCPYFLRYLGLTAAVHGNRRAMTTDSAQPMIAIGAFCDALGSNVRRRSRSKRRRSLKDHSCRVSMVRRASTLPGQRLTRQEREDTAGV